MAEEKKTEGQTHQCEFCGNTSEQAPLLSVERKGQSVFVCVRCLPTLIHGAY